MSAWLMIALQVVQADSGPSGYQAPRLPRPIEMSVLRHCDDSGAPEDIVVCGTPRDRYRLPLPVERAPTDRARGEAPTGMAALSSPARCGIFAGERRCSKREAAKYGYGAGRDPVTLLTQLAKKVADPDSD
jgi:hypothetical protein